MIDLCFECSFWERRIEMPESIIIGGKFFIIEPEIEVTGSEMMIRLMKDGRVVSVENAWYMGEVPARFRDLLPDNAELLGV